MLAFFGMLVHPIYGQFQFRNIDVEQGISQNSVVAISQDSVGNLWFATQDGLNKYNGEFTIYKEYFEDVTSTSDKSTGVVYTDRQGTVWIIDIKGELKQYNAVEDKFMQSRHHNISQIHQDYDLHYWLFSKQNELAIYATLEEEALTRIALDAKVYSIVQYKEAEVELLTNKGRIILHRNAIGKWDISARLNQQISFSDAIRDSDGVMWYTSFQDGLFYRNVNSPVLDTFTNDRIPELTSWYSIAVDQANNLWLGSYGNGVSMIEPSRKNIHHFLPKKNNQFSISYHDVLQVFLDKTGNMWFGTDGAGVDYFDPYLQVFELFTNGTVPEGINIDVIRAIEKNDNVLFIGTSGKGLTSYNESTEQWKTYKTTDGLPEDRIMSLYTDSNARLWIGTQFGGLAIASFSDSHLTKVIKRLDGYTIWTIKEGPQADQAWIGTHNNGLLLFDLNRGLIDSIPIRSDGKQVSIRDLAFFQDQIYIATDESGLFVHTKSNGVQPLTIGEEVEKIKCIQNDADIQLLIGTNGNGLYSYSFESQEIHLLANTELGLSNDVIYGAQKGDENTIWVSSNRGISELHFDSIHDNSPVQSIRNYDKEHGLQSYEFNTGASFQDKNGTIYFGGIEGLNYFDPTIQKGKNEHSFNTNIIEINVGDSTILPKLDAITIAPNENTFSIHYSGMQFSLPNKLKYKYRLSPYHSEWTESKNNTVSYMNIPAGSYDFEVKSTNYDDTWTGALTSQRIDVKEHWYLSSLFRIFLILGSLSFLYYLYYTKSRQLQYENSIEQNKLKAEYLEKLDQSRTTFYSNLTHEFRTPITIISGITKQLDIESKKKKTILRNSENLLHLVNQMLDLSKVESGAAQVEKKPIEIISFTRRLTNSFNSYAQNKWISLNFYSDLQKLPVNIDQEKFSIIVTNLISNALKCTPEYGQVLVTCLLVDDMLQIEVNDTGIGIKQEDIPKVFERFYQVEKNGKTGTGIGLALVKELVTLLEGDIEVSSEFNLGSKFLVSLPIERIESDELTVNGKANEDYEQTFDASILVIDDNLDLLEYISDVLKTKYNVIKSNSAFKALDLADKVIPDIILTDVMMPEMDGIKLVNLLKNNPKTSHIPVVMLTAKAGQDHIIKGLQAGAIAYMTKPFDEQELYVRLDRLLEERKRVHEYFSSNDSLPADQNQENEVITQIKNIINEQLANEGFGVSSLATLMQMDRTQLYRKVKAITGNSPSQLFRDQRMKHAKKLLKTTKKNISEIAFECGFSDPNYFSQVYKTSFEKSPSDDR